jgi:hypothetical protein
MGFDRQAVEAYLAKTTGSGAVARKRPATIAKRIRATTEWVAGQSSLPGAFLAIRTKSEMNTRDGWKARWARSKPAKERARVATLAYLPHSLIRRQGQLLVTLTRLAPRLLDDDNLRSALKSVRDGVAKAIGVDDGPGGRITWGYQQDKAPWQCYGVRIQIEEV